jgi:single-stranded-DNA-specific exonuclease
VLEPRCRWILPAPIVLDPASVAAGARHGLTPIVTELLARRDVAGDVALDAYFGPPAAGLHDPRLLPDADRVADRIDRARSAGERVMVFGDFDADGLTGLAILVRTLRLLGVEAVPYVPSRLDEGHGLSLAAVDTATAAGVTVLVTVDCGSTSHVEIEAARARGIAVIVTDHHRVPATPPPADALVNPHRPDAAYPDPRLSGAGIAFAVARLLLERSGRAGEAEVLLADLATVGTVADVAPLVGENRAIARLGLEQLAARPTAGLAALAVRAGIAPRPVDVEAIAFAIAPRLNAAGRIGEADLAARLLLTDDPAEADALAGELDAVNRTRRDLTREVLVGAREQAALATGPMVAVRGPWPVGIVGLVAARLAEESSLPAVVGANVGDRVRASLRGDGRLDLGATLEQLADLFDRFGGHAGAAGFELPADRWPAFVERFAALAEGAAPADRRPVLELALSVDPPDVGYPLLRDLARLAPTGPGNPDPIVAIRGARVVRVRAASGGHAQLVVCRERDVLDAIAFDRADLVGLIAEDDRIDIAARLVSRRFAGIETLQLEVRDVAPASGASGPAGDVAAGLAAAAP